jgi:hypothetical protein
VIPAADREDDPAEPDLAEWEREREAQRQQRHLDRGHGGRECDCPF